MSTQLGAFLCAMVLVSLPAFAGQKYRQSTNDVESRASDSTVGDIIGRLARELEPTIPVVVTQGSHPGNITIADSALNIIEAACLEEHVRAAMTPDIQALARRLGIDRIAINYEDATNEDPEETEYGAITIYPSIISQTLSGGQWKFSAFQVNRTDQRDIRPGDWDLDAYTVEKDRTLRVIEVQKEVQDPNDGRATRLTFVVKQDGEIKEGPTTVKVGNYEGGVSRYDFLNSLQERQKSYFNVPTGFVVSASRSGSDIINIDKNQITRRSREEDLLYVDVKMFNIRDQNVCYSKTPANDLRTELNRKLSVLTNGRVRQNYPESLAPRRTNNGSRGSN